LNFEGEKDKLSRNFRLPTSDLGRVTTQKSERSL